ncbi:MAG: S46 family peptidase [Bacteroidales bacterium]|jgi:hypothetical protein|nr:S46 family peptidase [Bacteroidales bacterium]
MNVFKRYLFLFVFLFSLFPLRAEEGMWVPILLEQTRYQRMREMGLSLTPEDIYSINRSSLKDAIVLFGGGCTGVVVSSQGLVMTNHHCGYGQIQAHSSLEYDYLTDGFWASSFKEELPNPGLNVAFLEKMEDVTSQVLANVTPGMGEKQRGDSIRAGINRMKKQFTPEGSYRVDIKPLYKGNQYFMYVYKVFNDVRMVGAPPSSIGKFGGDTDNWIWPRHTGDFAIFRIYAGKDNQPAEYSPDNVPYQPKKHVPVSTAGIRQGDFTMIYGYPAWTDEYISSYELDHLVRQDYPARVAMRTERLEIMDAYMQKDRGVRIQYAAKYASVSNAWKKWQGVMRGIDRADGLNKKTADEDLFLQKVRSNAQWTKDYGDLLEKMEQVIGSSGPFRQVSAYYSEAVLAVELVQLMRKHEPLFLSIISGKEVDPKIMNVLLIALEGFYKDYSLPVDRDIFVAMMRTYFELVPADFHFKEMNERMKKHKGSFEQWADDIYRKSVFRSYETIRDALTQTGKKRINSLSQDPFWAIYRTAKDMMQTKAENPYVQPYDSLSRVFMKARLELDRDKIFYPDGNHTLRVAYGKKEGYTPSDGITYLPYTTLDGVMEKDDPEIYDYNVPQALKTAYRKKDFGPYAENGRMPVCFIASNHTSGGNSGSPIFNGNGALIGLNFDRNWEGTMSDFLYDPAQCRNIIVDARYILFVTEKVYGAKRIVDEMQLVK